MFRERRHTGLSKTAFCAASPGPVDASTWAKTVFCFGGLLCSATPWIRGLERQAVCDVDDLVGFLQSLFISFHLLPHYGNV